MGVENLSYFDRVMFSGYLQIASMSPMSGWSSLTGHRFEDKRLCYDSLCHQKPFVGSATRLK